MTIKHRLIGLESVHAIHAIAVFTSNTQRDAHTYLAEDVGKVVKVNSPLAWFLIKSVSAGFATFVDISGGAPVSSVFGRTGAVTATAGDYVTSKVTNDSAVPGTTLKDALDEIETDMGAIATALAARVLSSDSRLSDSRTPTSHGSTHNPGGSDPITTGTNSTSVCIGNDSRLSDSRTPTAHNTSHQSGGSDTIKLDDLAAPDDNTDLDVSNSAHGLTPKLPNDSTKFLDGTGTYTVPTSGLFTAAGAWFTDIANPSPHADDQEFNGSSVPSGWSELDNQSVLTEAYANGFMQLTSSTHATSHVRGMYRACPPEAEWSIWAKCNVIGVPAATVACGVFVAADIVGSPTTAKVATCGIAMTSTTGANAFGQTWTNYNTGATTFGTPGLLSWAPWGYVRFGYDGTNFTTWVSNSGLEWIRLGTVAKTFTPLYAGIFVQNSTGATCYHMVDFYRVKAAAGASGAAAGLFMGNRLT